jgi:ribosome modulation factor
MLEAGGGMGRILSSFEEGWLTGLNPELSESDCPFEGGDDLATFWLDGFHTGRADALAMAKRASGLPGDKPDGITDVGLAA